jgi:hypothetical protein
VNQPFAPLIQLADSQGPGGIKAKATIPTQNVKSPLKTIESVLASMSDVVGVSLQSKIAISNQQVQNALEGEVDHSPRN